MRKLPLTLDEAEELREWLGSPGYSLFVNKVLPAFEANVAKSLATCDIDERKLLLQRAKIEGARELINYINNLKQTVRGLKE